MAFYDRIEREFSADEPWGTKQFKYRDREVRDVWEVETPKRDLQESKDSTFYCLHWSYRSLSKFRYLRYFVR